jgi:hypothetical protein
MYAIFLLKTLKINAFRYIMSKKIKSIILYNKLNLNVILSIEFKLHQN